MCVRVCGCVGVCVLYIHVLYIRVCVCCTCVYMCMCVSVCVCHMWNMSIYTFMASGNRRILVKFNRLYFSEESMD